MTINGFPVVEVVNAEGQRPTETITFGSLAAMDCNVLVKMVCQATGETRYITLDKVPEPLRSELRPPWPAAT